VIFLKKIAPKSFGIYFSEKNAPNAKKYCPNGEILPNLVTLLPGIVSHIWPSYRKDTSHGNLNKFGTFLPFLFTMHDVTIFRQI
jgi:hypothetical protein